MNRQKISENSNLLADRFGFFYKMLLYICHIRLANILTCLLRSDTWTWRWWWYFYSLTEILALDDLYRHKARKSPCILCTARHLYNLTSCKSNRITRVATVINNREVFCVTSWAHGPQKLSHILISIIIRLAFRKSGLGHMFLDNRNIRNMV